MPEESGKRIRSLDDLVRAMNDGAKLLGVTVAIHASTIDPCPDEKDSEPLSLFDFLVMLEKFPDREALKKIGMYADSGGEFGGMFPVTKSEMSLKLNADGTGRLEVMGNECHGI
jgi:hypothetical protein